METKNDKLGLFYGIGKSEDTKESIEGKDVPAKEEEHKRVRSKPSAKKQQIQEQEEKIKTSLYLPPEKFRALKIHCAEEGILMTPFIEEAIDLKIKADIKKRDKTSTPL